MFQCFFWKVLSPVFTVHWGLAKKKGRPTWRERFFFVFQFCHFPIFKFLSWLVSSFYFFSGKTQTTGRGSLTSRRSCMPGPDALFLLSLWEFKVRKNSNAYIGQVQPWLCSGVGSGAGGHKSWARQDDEKVQAGQTHQKARRLSFIRNNCYTKNKLVITAMIQNKFYSAYEKLSDWVCAKIFLWVFFCFSSFELPTICHIDNHRNFVDFSVTGEWEFNSEGILGQTLVGTLQWTSVDHCFDEKSAVPHRKVHLYICTLCSLQCIVLHYSVIQCCSMLK